MSSILLVIKDIREAFISKTLSSQTNYVISVMSDIYFFLYNYLIETFHFF